MKLKNEPIFLIASLCIFFPIGIILLVRSEFSRLQKWLMSVCGFIVFSALLSIALINPPTKRNPIDFHLTTTRNTLSIGQSGGLAVTSGDDYLTNYDVKTDSDILKVHDSVFTAIKAGQCTITVTYGSVTQSVAITVTDEKRTDAIVYASPSATRYHRTENHAGKHGVSMTEEEAIRSEKTPCKVCYGK